MTAARVRGTDGGERRSALNASLPAGRSAVSMRPLAWAATAATPPRVRPQARSPAPTRTARTDGHWDGRRYSALPRLAIVRCGIPVYRASMSASSRGTRARRRGGSDLGSRLVAFAWVPPGSPFNLMPVALRTAAKDLVGRPFGLHESPGLAHLSLLLSLVWRRHRTRRRTAAFRRRAMGMTSCTTLSKP